MINLKRLLKQYDFNLKLKELSLETKPEKDHAVDNTAELSCKIELNKKWPIDFLPSTKYLVKTSEKYLEMKEKWRNEDLTIEKISKLTKVLTQIDLNLINAITAEDLINYDGNSSSLAISHILNKNNALLLFITRKYNKKKIFSFLKYALKYKNYNLMHILIKSLQSLRLSIKRIESVLYYKEFLDKQEDGVFPFDWMLQDCEDSNLNIASEVASIRFCKIIDKLKKMKNLKYDFKVSEKSVHVVYSQLWDTIREGSEILDLGSEGQNEKQSNLFLVL